MSMAVTAVTSPPVTRRASAVKPCTGSLKVTAKWMFSSAEGLVAGVDSCSTVGGTASYSTSSMSEARLPFCATSCTASGSTRTLMLTQGPARVTWKMYSAESTGWKKLTRPPVTCRSSAEKLSTPS